MMIEVVLVICLRLVVLQRSCVRDEGEMNVNKASREAAIFYVWAPSSYVNNVP